MAKTKIFLTGLFLAVIAALAAMFIWYKSVTRQVFVKIIDPVLATSSPTPKKYPDLVTQHLTEKTPFNVLLLGYGGGSHDGTYLTDSMIVAHIDPSLSKVTLISLPRDIWVNNRKINSAYSDGITEGAAAAGKLAKEAASAVIGQPVDFFVSLDFAGFQKTIDTLGGVDVTVDIAFDDYQYPIAGQENALCDHTESELPAITATASATKEPQLIFPCRYEHLHFDKGLTHMDGVTALKYVRSRHSAQDGNDFSRSRRQKNLILAVKQKVLSINFLSRAVSFVNSLGADLRTDLTESDAKSLLQNSSIFSSYQITSLALTDENYLTSSYNNLGQYILIPTAGVDNWSSVQTWINQSLQ